MPTKDPLPNIPRLVRKSYSCPCFSMENECESTLLLRTRSRSETTRFYTKCKFQFLRWIWSPQRAYSSVSAADESVVKDLKEVCSVTACPCPDACCLPPPCNQPAKCLQNITGYYYYPYGTWFCGPYHIKTGPCGPCAGPVQPGNSCGPAPPNPGGPCGPCGVVLCGPGASCAQCRCAPCPGCGLCDPCGCCACGCCGPCGPCGPCYDPFSPCGLPGACSPCCACGSYSICNGPCGPCFNIPCTPIQVCGPIKPGGPCGPTNNPLDFSNKCCLCSNTQSDTGSYKWMSTCARVSGEVAAAKKESDSAVSSGCTISAESRVNVYPSLKKCVFAPDKVQTRFCSTLVGTRLRSQTLKSNGIKEVKMRTFCGCNRCWPCRYPCSGCRRCPALCSPRCLPTKEERDQPWIPPNCFCYSNTPKYRNPTPYTDTLKGVYTNSPWSCS